MPRALASLIALGALALSASASACPVCGQGAPGSEGAYLFMSGVLSALPLLMVGGIVTWIILRVRAAANEPLPPRVDAASAKDPGAPDKGAPACSE